MNRRIAKSIYLLRHAKSSWDDPTIDDHDRPLAPRGRRAAKQLADHFRRSAIRPDLVICSSAARARDTLTPVAAAIGPHDRAIHIEPGLYGATADELLERLRVVDEEVRSVLVVGHNPGLQDLALEFARDDPEVAIQLREKFPTAALAVVVFDGSWSELLISTARVASVTIPRDLPS